MEQPTILICGNYGAGNFGDELILKGLLKTVKELHPEEIIVTSGNPRETATGHDVTAIHFFPSSILSLCKSILTLRFFKSIYYLLMSDLILFGGGCLFNEKEPASIIIWYRQFQWFRVFRKKVIIVGQSFGKFENQDAVSNIKEVIKYSEKIFVRDKFSKKMLSSFTASDIEVLLDPALWLDEGDFPVRVEEASQTEYPYILLTIRKWSDMDMDNLQKKITLLAKYCFEKYQLPSRILILQKGIYGDEEISRELYRKIESYGDTPPRDWITIEELASFYRNAAMVLSMRLHGGLLGLILGKPTLFINYDDKVGNLLTDLGLQDMLIYPNTDQMQSKAESLLVSALSGNFQSPRMVSRKSHSKVKFGKYLTKIVNSLK